MKRALLLLVPVVLVGGIVVLAFVTQEGGGDRKAAEAGIRRAVESREDPGATGERIGDYLSQYGASPDARWFAAEQYLAIGRPASAAHAVWAPPAMRGDAATAPRFARMYLDARARPTPKRPQGDVRALLTLADEDVGSARSSVLDRVRRDPDVGWAVEASLLLARSGSPFLASVQDALRARGTPEAQFAAAVTAAGPDRPKDADLLVVAVEGRGLRIPPPILLAVTVALGASGDEVGREVLDARAKASGDPQVDPTALPWLAGLAAAGDAKALGNLAETVARWGGGPSAPYFIDAIMRRIGKDDPAAVRAAVSIWQAGLPPPSRRLFAASLCRLRPGPDSLVVLDPVFREIKSSDDPVLVVIAAVKDLRGSDPSSVLRLMDVFLRLEEDHEPAAGSADSEALLAAATGLSNAYAKGSR